MPHPFASAVFRCTVSSLGKHFSDDVLITAWRDCRTWREAEWQQAKAEAATAFRRRHGLPAGGRIEVHYRGLLRPIEQGIAA